MRHLTVWRLISFLTIAALLVLLPPTRAFFDRWWQQMAILIYFHNELPTGGGATVDTTVNQTSGGTPLSDQLVPIPFLTPGQADSQLAPYICDTSRPPPGNAG